MTKKTPWRIEFRGCKIFRWFSKLNGSIAWITNWNRRMTENTNMTLSKINFSVSEWYTWLFVYINLPRIVRFQRMQNGCHTKRRVRHRNMTYHIRLWAQRCLFTAWQHRTEPNLIQNMCIGFGLTTFHLWPPQIVFSINLCPSKSESAETMGSDQQLIGPVKLREKWTFQNLCTKNGQLIVDEFWNSKSWSENVVFEIVEHLEGKRNFQKSLSLSLEIRL